MARISRVDHYAHRIYEAAINVLALPGMFNEPVIELVSEWLQAEADAESGEEREFTLRLKALIEDIDKFNREL